MPHGFGDRIAVLDGGRIVADGTPDELKRLVPGSHIRLRFADAAALDTAARPLVGNTRDDFGLTLTAPSGEGVDVLRGVLNHLDAAGLEVDDLRTTHRQAVLRRRRRDHGRDGHD